METTLSELAEQFGGRVCGDPQAVIRSAATLERAGKGDISFLANRKYHNLLRKTKATAVVVANEFESPAALLVVDDPYYVFTQIVVMLHGHRKHKKTGRSAKASIAPTAKVGKETHVHDFVTIDDKAQIGARCILYPGVYVGPGTRIGDDCILYPNVVIYDGCTVGNRVIIQANATVGEDGFGFATHNGEHHKIPHIGTVIVEDDVELGAGCAIERGTLDDTLIGRGSKIGDSVVIGHGTRIGEHCLLVAQVGVAGSTTLGHHCVAAGQAGITGHVKVGNEVVIAAKAGVVGNVADREKVLGMPAFNADKARRAYALIKFLPELRKTIHRLEERLSKLEKGED